VSLHPRNSPFFAGQAGRTSDSSAFGFAEYRILGQFREPRLFETAADAQVAGTIEQQIRSSFNFARRSATAEIGRKVTPRVGVIASYQIQRTDLFDEAYDPREQRLIDRVFSQVRLSSVSVSVIRDTRRDDVVDPAVGHYVSASIQVAARKIGSEVGFAKTFIRAQAFRTVPPMGRVVLAGNASLGLAAGFRRQVETVDATGDVIVSEVDDLPASERFFAGGDVTVRGFALDRLGRPDTLDEDGFPLGGNALMIFNMEARARIVGPVSAVGFLDTGNVFRRAADIDLTQLRSAVGVGLRYRSPVGPIRFDVGFKVRRDEIAGQREKPYELHFSFGQAF
jgi:outer membrane translocation and assembly module TamA